MLKIGAVVVKVADRRRAARFWSEALGYDVRGGRIVEDESVVLVAGAGGGPTVTLDEDDGMHLDLHVAGHEELEAEVGRLVSLGARRPEWLYPAGANFVVLADTEGNLFCVVDTTSHGGAEPK
jgi:catechol 2,3-dioxygenase-like lactoylglutathione lyase family enzyme